MSYFICFKTYKCQNKKYTISTINHACKRMALNDSPLPKSSLTGSCRETIRFHDMHSQQEHHVGAPTI